LIFERDDLQTIKKFNIAKILDSFKEETINQLGAGVVDVLKMGSILSNTMRASHIEIDVMLAFESNFLPLLECIEVFKKLIENMKFETVLTGNNVT
jgi:hypothetical protein